jgi:hypothetical protein
VYSKNKRKKCTLAQVKLFYIQKKYPASCVSRKQFYFDIQQFKKGPKIEVIAPRHKLNCSPAVSGKNFYFDIKQELVDSKNKRNCTST